jgi:hypothetical protein
VFVGKNRFQIGSYISMNMVWYELTKLLIFESLQTIRRLISMSNASPRACFLYKAFILRLCSIGLILITRVVNKRLSMSWIINLGSIRIVMKNLSLTIQCLLVSLLPRVILCFNNWWQTFNFELLLNFMYFSKCLRILSGSLSLFRILDLRFNHTLGPWVCRPHTLSVKCAVTS